MLPPLPQQARHALHQARRLPRPLGRRAQGRPDQPRWLRSRVRRAHSDLVARGRPPGACGM